MNMPNLRGVVLLLTLFASAGARAEEPASASSGTAGPSPSATPSTNAAWFSRAWQAEEGLPGNTVVGIAQTPDGFFWVATEGGLARFDGVRFHAAATLRDPAQAFVTDRQGRLWLGKFTSAGVEVACLDTATTRTFPRSLWAMAADADGAVWIAAGRDVHRIQDGRWTNFSTEDGVPSDRGRTYLVCDGRGQLWLARRNQVLVYRDGKFRALLTLNEPCSALHGARAGGVWIGAGRRLLKYSGEGEPQELGALTASQAGTETTVLCESRQGQVWIGTRGAGLFLFNGAGFDEVAQPNREILCLTEDQEGSLWLGTRGGGLVRVRPRAFEFQALNSTLPPEGVRSVCQDTDGTMWAVTTSGRLARKEGPLWRVLSAADGWSESAATCVTAAPEGGVWVGTQSEGLRRWHEGKVRVLDMPDGLASRQVSALLTAPSGDVWLGTVSSNAVQRLRDGHFETFMLSQTVGPFSSLAVDALGDVWAASEGGLLAKVEQEALVDQTTNTLRTHHPITSLCATPDGSLWIGYRGFGVGRLWRGRFTRFGAEQGLEDEFVQHIVPDGAGRLWFVAHGGVFSVLQKEFEAVAEARQARVRSVVYGRDEGVAAFQSRSGSWPGAARSADGQLWFPGLSGLLVVDPSRMKENREPPPVVIERVVVDGQEVAVYEGGPKPRAPGSIAPLDLRQPGTRLRLSPGPKQVELDYTGLSFVAPRNVAFRYRLQGLDPGWLEAGARRVAYFSHLPPGDYHFEVTACNNDGVWSREAAALALTVLPHFWQTGWFRLASVAGFMACVGGAAWAAARRRSHRRIERLEQLNALERERSRIARDIHDELGSNLTRIAWLSELASADKTLPDQVEAHSRKIGGYAHQMVQSLDEIVWAVDPSKDTFQSLAQYLTHLAHEHFDPTSVNCRLEIPLDLPAVALPSELRHDLLLAAKEALHNILKHAAAREACIRLAIADGVLRLVIEDNGRGFDPASPSPSRPGHGLANLRQRIENLGGQFQCDSAPGRGTRLTFTVKLPKGA